jgi:hypothetical protein
MGKEVVEVVGWRSSGAYNDLAGDITPSLDVFSQDARIKVLAGPPHAQLRFAGDWPLVAASAQRRRGDRSAHSIEEIETADARFTAIALDGDGYPVISYVDAIADALKVVHCDDPDCAPGAGGEDVVSVQNVGGLGDFPSLVLDASGNPVVAFKNGLPLSETKLHILHCNDADCSPGGDSVTVPDQTISDQTFPDIVLDDDGNPVVSYRRRNTGGQEGVLRLLDCNDPNCDPLVPAGGEPNGGTDFTAGTDTSLELDSTGNPVIAYASDTSPGLKVMHCDETLCVGNDVAMNTHRSINVDWVSLELDASGLPVVAYSDETNDLLRVIHCDDTLCDCPVELNCSCPATPCTPPCPPAPCELQREISHVVDFGNNVGQMVDLELDAAGNPVLAYYDARYGDLKVLHCVTPDCSTGNEINSPDFAGNVGHDLALELDSAGNPVISYHDASANKLKVLHCADPKCYDGDGDNDGCSEKQEAGGDPTDGGQRDGESFWDFYDVPTGALLLRDRSVSAPDIFAVISRFNTSGNANIDPLSIPPASGYHTAYDRGTAVGDPWDLTAANGSIASTDIFAVLAQFNHSC